MTNPCGSIRPLVLLQCEGAHPRDFANSVRCEPLCMNKCLGCGTGQLGV